MKDNRIIGAVDVSLTFEEIGKINALLERDEPAQVIQTARENTYKCPICCHLVPSEFGFCPMCGQRLDAETIAL